MIIRKPYAFLIKNFRKIHIVLLLLSFYVLYKTFDVAHFVNNFMTVGSYDLYANPITDHITGIMNIAILILIIGSISLLFLLHHKKKPWKVYLLPFATYLFLFFILGMIKSFFSAYTEVVDSADLRLSRDLLMLLLMCQLPAIGIYIMRTFGLDVKKFDFNSDIEFLDLSDEDREEIEVSLDVDINTFKRFYRRVLRNIGYFWKEHKIISSIIILIVSGFILSNVYIFLFINQRTYKQGQVYKRDGFSIVVKDAYFTDKDNLGNVISKKQSNFVIVRVEVTNNDENERKIDTSYFHLRAWGQDYITSETTYAKEFSDFGKCISREKAIQSGEKLDFIIVFKVSKKIGRGRFKLYYQERGGIYKLRRIKTKIKDVRKIEPVKELKVGDFMDIDIYGNEDSLSIDSFKITDSIEYKTNRCTSVKCTTKINKYNALEGEKILTLDFASEAYEAKNIIDFLTEYGKINYKNSKGKNKSIDIKIAVDKNYYGKTVYLRVPNDVSKLEDVSLHFIIRNKEYNYKLS